MAERTHRFPGVAREVLRDGMLDVVLEALVSGVPEQVRMADIATVVGVSRQTVYNEFGTKQAMVGQLVERETRRLRDDLTAVLHEHPAEAAAAIGAGCTLLLRRARSNQMLKAILSGDQSLLPLVTTNGAPVIAIIAAAFREHFCQQLPTVDRELVDFAADSLTRLVVSHVLVPHIEIEQAARGMAQLLNAYLNEVSD